MKNKIIILYGLMMFPFFDCSAQILGDTVIISYEKIELKYLKKNYGNNLITNKADYKNLFEYKWAVEENPHIDFEKYSLITIRHGASGCSKPVSELVIKKNGNKYIAKINISEDGTCRLMFPVRYFCLIPKVEHNDKIEFIIKRKIIPIFRK